MAASGSAGLVATSCPRCLYRAAEAVCSTCHTPKPAAACGGGGSSSGARALTQTRLPFASGNVSVAPASMPTRPAPVRPSPSYNQPQSGSSSQTRLPFASVPPSSPMLPTPPNLDKPDNLPPCCDYDVDSVTSWIFPQSEQYATREYQLNIVRSALLRNTMVVLPTGLGKTFIAAVVMYNYLRWFPRGKIIFTAPTRPLVTQQIQACHDIVGIREEETAEMSGQVDPTKRAALWQNRRVFYCTPQCIQKDLEAGLVPTGCISLIVVDEAHKAVGQYAYAVVVAELAKVSAGFRVLALSATPGKDRLKVQEILDNLRIQALEYKSETDPDVKPYVFQKMIEIVQVNTNPTCQRLVDMLNNIAGDKLRGLRASGHFNSLPGDVASLNTYRMTQLLESFSVRDCDGNAGLFYSLQASMSTLAALLHSRELLTRHGVNAMRSHLRANYEGADVKRYKKALIATGEWQKFVRCVDEAVAAGGGNPKIDKLVDVLTDHFARFAEAEKQTSVIVFAQFRDSVAEICAAVAKHTTLRVSPFVGQSNGRSSSAKSKDDVKPAPKRGAKRKKGAAAAGDKDEDDGLPAAAPESVAARGQTQREQQQIVQQFRRNEIDVLVATCIGEEGLDIGSVDLVVSFDALASPVRMVQRLGRAGRKRAGRIVVLVADEKEKDTMSSGAKMSATVHKLLREGAGRLNFFRPPPEASMLPAGLRPAMVYRTFQIDDYNSQQVGGRRKHVSVAVVVGALTRTHAATVQRKPGASAALSEYELGFLQRVYGAQQQQLLLGGSSDMSSLPRLRRGMEADFSVPAQIVGSSGRFKVVQRVRRFIENEEWTAADLALVSHRPAASATPRVRRRNGSSDEDGAGGDDDDLLNTVVKASMPSGGGDGAKRRGGASDIDTPLPPSPVAIQLRVADVPAAAQSTTGGASSSSSSSSSTESDGHGSDDDDSASSTSRASQASACLDAVPPPPPALAVFGDEESDGEPVANAPPLVLTTPAVPARSPPSSRSPWGSGARPLGLVALRPGVHASPRATRGEFGGLPVLSVTPLAPATEAMQPSSSLSMPPPPPSSSRRRGKATFADDNDDSPSPFKHGAMAATSAAAVSPESSPSPVLHRAKQPGGSKAVRVSPPAFDDDTQSPVFRGRPSVVASTAAALASAASAASEDESQTPIRVGGKRRAQPRTHRGQLEAASDDGDGGRRFIEFEAEGSGGGSDDDDDGESSDEDGNLPGFIDDSTPVSEHTPGKKRRKRRSLDVMPMLHDSPLHALRFGPGNRTSALSMPIIEATLAHLSGRGPAPQFDSAVLQRARERIEEAAREEEAELSDTLDPDESLPAIELVPVKPNTAAPAGAAPPRRIGEAAASRPGGGLGVTVRVTAPFRCVWFRGVLGELTAGAYRPPETTAAPAPSVPLPSAPTAPTAPLAMPAPAPLDTDARRRIEEKRAHALQLLRAKRQHPALVPVWCNPHSAIAASVLGGMEEARTVSAVVDVDVCVSFRVGVVLWSQHEACAMAEADLELAAQRVLCRYASACVVFVADGSGCLLSQASSPLAAGFKRIVAALRSFVGLRVFTAVDARGAADLVRGLAAREGAAGLAKVAAHDPDTAVAAFFSSPRNSNPAVAAHVLAAFKGWTVAAALSQLTGEAVKQACPGICAVQANKLAMFFKRSWTPPAS